MGTSASKRRNEEIIEKLQTSTNLTNSLNEVVNNEKGAPRFISNKNSNSYQQQQEEEKKEDYKDQDKKNEQQHQQQQQVEKQRGHQEREVGETGIAAAHREEKDQTKTIPTTKTKAKAITSIITSTTTAERPAATVTHSKLITATTSATASQSTLPRLQPKSQSHRLKQNSSTWSLNSLFGSRLRWSFSDNSRHSFRNRNKSTRKSFSSLRSTHRQHQQLLDQQKQQEQQERQQQQYQEQLKRSKTTWHKPTTNAIFSSHFKESSHQIEQYQIEQFVAKGSFGIVFKVFNKQQQLQQLQLSQEQQQKQKQRPQQIDLFSQRESSLSRKSPAITKTKSLDEPSTSASTLKSTTTSGIREVIVVDSSSPIKPTYYALKVLKKSKIISDNSVKQIKDEADIQKLCGHHPFIVQQLDLWQNRHNLFILSEYIPNGELFSKITSFSIDLVRLYLAEIALAIDFLHNAGIIYRDAKPENILLTDKFHIKLTDFGLSKWLKVGMQTRTLCGTLQYMGTN